MQAAVKNHNGGMDSSEKLKLFFGILVANLVNQH